MVELQSLTGTIGKIGEVLLDDDEQSRALRETLAEIVGRTESSRARSKASSLLPSRMTGWRLAYANLGHGIGWAIRNGLGHCIRMKAATSRSAAFATV